MAGEKTEKPTPRRLAKARKEGRIARTQDLGAWLAMLAGGAMIPMTFNHLKDTVEGLFTAWPGVIVHPDPAVATQLLGQGVRSGASALVPLLGTVMLVGVLSAVAQGGVTLTGKPLKPTFSRLNPVRGLKKSFGPQGLWEGAKAMIRTAVLSAVLWQVLHHTVTTLLGSDQMPLSAVVGTVLDALASLLRAAGATGLALAAVDYAVVRRRTAKGLRMSHQDIKEETRRSEGDPQLKGAIRSRQFAMSRNRMMADVANADVVLVNPTHVAVALCYDPTRGAPRVVAKGAGVVAVKIRERAHEHRVPMVENVPLARALHRVCEIGQEIPPELYTAVARVLAFVMSLRARGSSAGLHRPAHLVDETLNSFATRPKGKAPGPPRRPPGNGQLTRAKS